MAKIVFLLIVVSFILLRCQSSNNSESKTSSTTINLTYAKKFKVKKTHDATILELLGDKNSENVTATFVLYKNKKPLHTKNAYYVKIPVERVASMSSIYTSMLLKLKCETSIIGIDHIDYYTNSFIQKKVNTNEIIELSNGTSIHLEKILMLKPDLVFTFGMGNPKNDIDEKL